MMAEPERCHTIDFLHYLWYNNSEKASIESNSITMPIIQSKKGT